MEHMRAFDKWWFRIKPQKIIFLDIDGVLNSMGNRSLEVKDWMRGKRIRSFVILDDTDYDWEENSLGEHWVRTSFMEGGLTRELAQKAVYILNQSS